MKIISKIFLLAVLVSGGVFGQACGQNAGRTDVWQAWSKCPDCSGKGTVIVVKCITCGGSGNCQGCDGTGYQKSSSSRSRVGCLVCKGTGQCKTCNGTGGTREKCSACKGTGQLLRSRDEAQAANAPSNPDRGSKYPSTQGADATISSSNPTSERRATMNAADFNVYTVRQLQIRYEAKDFRLVGFREVLKSRARFVGKVLQSEAYILKGNPRGVVASVSASPAADEIILLLTQVREGGVGVSAMMDRGPALRKAVITYGVQNFNDFVLFSIAEPGSAAKPAPAPP